MRVYIAFALTIIAALAFYGPASADEVSAPIARCINENAPKVEMAVSDLNQAVTFLLQDVCATPVAKDNFQRTKNRMEDMNARMQKACDEEKSSGAANQPKDMTDACSMARVSKIGFVNTESDSDTAPVFVGQATPAAIALASNTLLDLRLSHLKSGTIH